MLKKLFIFILCIITGSPQLMQGSELAIRARLQHEKNRNRILATKKDSVMAKIKIQKAIIDHQKCTLTDTLAELATASEQLTKLKAIGSAAITAQFRDKLNTDPYLKNLYIRNGIVDFEISLAPQSAFFHSDCPEKQAIHTHTEYVATLRDTIHELRVFLFNHANTLEDLNETYKDIQLELQFSRRAIRELNKRLNPDSHSETSELSDSN